MRSRDTQAIVKIDNIHFKRNNAINRAKEKYNERLEAANESFTAEVKAVVAALEVGDQRTVREYVKSRFQITTQALEPVVAVLDKPSEV